MGFLFTQYAFEEGSRIGQIIGLVAFDIALIAVRGKGWIDRQFGLC